MENKDLQDNTAQLINLFVENELVEFKDKFIRK